MKCTETDDEQPTFSKENFLQLSCFISQEVKYMLSGIKSVRLQMSTERNELETIIFKICLSRNCKSN